MTDTITLPRSVLEQALDALNASMPHNNDMDEDWPSHIAARRALRTALEQPQVEQEPVAWGSGEGYWIQHIYKQYRPDYAKYTIPFYSRHQPRQPLTDEQINDHRIALAYDSEDLPDPWDFKQGVRAAERAHGIGGEA